ncbi:MAG: hypothetical protein EOO13_15445 [Chitinophagaceae bacterium]|nr:MAG: hypothetical protein EOO13_15445 [Chitinophagaceae bacterium]
MNNKIHHLRQGYTYAPAALVIMGILVSAFFIQQKLPYCSPALFYLLGIAVAALGYYFIKKATGKQINFQGEKNRMLLCPVRAKQPGRHSPN